MTQIAPELDVQQSFRAAMGHYATGIAVITAHQGDRRYGMAVNSFTSVSLSPPMLLFCPSYNSTTWSHIAEVGSFGISFLAAGQEHVSRVFAGSSPDRFANQTWTATPKGHPILSGSLGWIDCSVDSVHPGGDHNVVLARADSWGCANEPEDPLIFFKGKYCATA